MQDTSQKNVFTIGKDGKIRRDKRFEQIEKHIEEKDQLNIDAANNRGDGISIDLNAEEEGPADNADQQKKLEDKEGMALEDLLALGNCYCSWTRFVNAISFPKLRTPHYNENGQQIYTSPVTICFFFTLIIGVLALSIHSIVPMFSS